MLKLINTKNFDLDKKLELLNLNELSIRELVEMKSKINEILDDKITSSENTLEFGSNYKKLELLVDGNLRKNFIVREDGIIIGTDSNAKNFYIGKVLSKAFYDEEDKIIYVNISSEFMKQNLYDGKISSINNNFGILREEVTYSFVTMRNLDDRRNYIDLINTVVDREASSYLYKDLTESDEINYNNDLEMTLSSLYLENSNNLNEFVNIILNSEKNKSKAKVRVKDY